MPVATSPHGRGADRCRAPPGCPASAGAPDAFPTLFRKASLLPCFLCSSVPLSFKRLLEPQPPKIGVCCIREQSRPDLLLGAGQFPAFAAHLRDHGVRLLLGTDNADMVIAIRHQDR